MKTVSVELTGISPLLMHRFPLHPIEGLEKKPPLEQAELALYQLPDGKIYVPSVNVSRSLVAGGAWSKGKGRGNLSNAVAATVFVSPEAMILPNQEWELDSRRVVIGPTKGAIIRHRPKFPSWQLECEISYDEILMTEQQLRRIVDDAGNKVGLCDFRPQKKGPFGRFMVTRWKA